MIGDVEGKKKGGEMKGNMNSKVCKKKTCTKGQVKLVKSKKNDVSKGAKK
jgi:hypothetical protein